MTPTSRRVLRLASTALVATGLTIVSLPGTTTAEESVLQLTEQQEQSLEHRLEANPYAAAETSVDSLGVENTAEASADTAASTDAGTITATPTTRLETALGMAVTTPLAGTDRGYAVLTSLGSISRRTASGQPVWQRDNLSLYDDWQVQPVRAYQVEPFPARITMGFNAVSPFTDSSEHGFATGDLTGDGVADIAFTAEAGIRPFRSFTSPGSSLLNGTFVTVLDGATGRTLWSKLFADAQQVTLVDGTLLVADQPATNQNAPVAGTTTLQAFRFSLANGSLTADAAWTYETGERTARWGAVQPLGGGLFAVSWNKRKTATSPGLSRTLVLAAGDGRAVWQTDGSLYSRQLVHDAARHRIVALEQADNTDAVRYELAAYDVGTGSRTTLDGRVNALALDLAVGDVSGDSLPEYVVSEDTLDPTRWVNASTVRALDGGNGNTELWTHTVKREDGNTKDGPSAFGLEIADRRVLASYIVTEGSQTAANTGGSRFGRLTSLAGKDGTVRWDHAGAVASPIYAEPFRTGDGWYARTVDLDQNIRTYQVDNGRQTGLTPLQGDLSVAQAVDVNGDGIKDLVTGGTSRGIWAYDGPSLVAGEPRLLWTRTLPGRVHAIELADTAGDKLPELLVAAESAAVVLNARDGGTLADIDGRGQLVRSVTGADVNGDGRAEVLVPTDQIRAFSGTGRALWSHTPSGAPVTFSDLAVADGKVFATSNTRGTIAKADIVARGVALNASTGTVAWAAQPTWAGSDHHIYSALLGHGTFASERIPYADGHAVVMTWTVRTPFPTTLVEIRDGRTGEVVHSAAAGGFNTVGNYFVGDEGLLLASTAAFRTYGPGSVDHRIFTLPPLHTGAFANGPGGRRLLVGGTENGMYVWDPAVLTAGSDYPQQLAKFTGFGIRNILAGDLDGDGVDELVGFNLDAVGHDQMMELSGARYRVGDDSLHGLVVTRLTQP